MRRRRRSATSTRRRPSARGRSPQAWRLAPILAALLAAAALLAGLVYLARPRQTGELQASLSVASALRTGTGEGFARALAPRAFSFPADHGPHPEFRTEWWYWTGNLSTPEGRRFGFQLTFFRNALAPDPPRRSSAWATRDVYLAHFTLTDVEGRRFHSFERVRRGALGLAGAQAQPFRVWLDDWRVGGPPAGSQATPMHLAASAGDVGIDLVLDRGKPPVLQGDRGLSRKGTEPGQASYYYSLTRMPARGRIHLEGSDLPVEGLAWMDREWSTSSLGADQVGWDWFSLQLDDGRDLMYYQLRRRDGTPDPASSGTLVAPDGSASPLALHDVRLEVLDRWTSPRSGAKYPSRWRLRLPSAGLDLEIRPRLADQELDTSFRYWEGAVEITGTAAGRPLTGSGYVELTGYGERHERGETR